MGVDETSLERIRNASFSVARRGYDREEVDRFLAKLADWLETGAGGEERTDAVQQELKKVGERTGAILAQAEDTARQIRAEAENEVAEARSVAQADAAQAVESAQEDAERIIEDANQ